jgi:hypothetical protein
MRVLTVTMTVTMIMADPDDPDDMTPVGGARWWVVSVRPIWPWRGGCGGRCWWGGGCP